eukprot:1688317-Pyramimonas_sp.AAC.1
MLDVKGYNVDAKGYMVDVKGYSVDANVNPSIPHLYGVHLRHGGEPHVVHKHHPVAAPRHHCSPARRERHAQHRPPHG